MWHHITQWLLKKIYLFKSSQTIAYKWGGLLWVIVAYAHTSAVSVFFTIFTSRYKIGNLVDTRYAMWCHTWCYLHIELCWISRQGTELQKFYQRSYVVNLSDLCNAINQLRLYKALWKFETLVLYNFITCNHARKAIIAICWYSILKCIIWWIWHLSIESNW